MEINLSYGRSRLVLNLPPPLEVDVYKSSTADRPVTFESFKAAFLESGGKKFFEGKPPLVVVNDGYRHTPTPQILEWLETINPGFLENAVFLIATGSHSAPKPEHFGCIFGRFYELLKNRIAWHQATDTNQLQRLGVDQFGEEVYINRLLFDAEKVFIIGSVEPHYFAGFTGGCKSVFPGLTDLETIERNHNMAISLAAAPLKIENNPLAEHLWSLLDFFDKDKFFTVQLVIDCQKQIAGAFWGRIKEAFNKARTLAEILFTSKVSRLYDVVICELLPPLDKNLYQAQKALENCQVAVAEGGTAVVVSACNEGVGSDYFFRLAENWNRQSNEPQDGIVRFGAHKLSRVNALSKRMGIRIHSQLSDDIVRRVFYEPMSDINKFITEKIATGELNHLAVVFDAGQTVLRI